MVIEEHPEGEYGDTSRKPREKRGCQKETAFHPKKNELWRCPVEKGRKGKEVKLGAEFGHV